MIGVINYGLGNIQAFLNIYDSLGIQASAVSSCSELRSATHLILPGVGSFDSAMQNLQNSGLYPLLNKQVLNYKIPVLGVCVGMQVMADSSQEGDLPGLSWIQGQVSHFRNFDSILTNFKYPHMGWNDPVLSDHPLFEGISHPRFYFLHSYCFQPTDTSHVLAYADYGNQFTAAVGKDSIFGVQFHPEKSHHWGIRLLSNFAKI